MKEKSECWSCKGVGFVNNNKELHLCSQCDAWKDVKLSPEIIEHLTDFLAEWAYTDEGSKGQWMNNKEINIKLMPWQFYVKTTVERFDGAEVVRVELARKPHISQAVKYIEIENNKK
jgi:hypothetical protein